MRSTGHTQVLNEYPLYSFRVIHQTICDLSKVLGLDWTTLALHQKEVVRRHHNWVRAGEEFSTILVPAVTISFPVT